jgi:transposase
MNRAYADYSTRLTARELRLNPAVPPKKNLKHPWEYDRELYKRHIERFFRRLKGFRGIFTRYDKLDRIFTAFIYPAVICIAFPCMNTP